MQKTKPYPAKDRTATDYHLRVEHVVDQILANPALPFSVKDLAGHAAFSEFHFHRVFKAVTGESVSQCIIRLRLEAAASALVYQRKAPVTQIALDCGFSNSAHFSKAFRKAYDCAPTQFRQNQPTDFRISRIGKARPAGSNYSGGMNVNVEILSLPKRTLANLRLIGPYSHAGISRLYADLGAWFQSTLGRPLPKESINVTWSDSALADQETWRLDACYEVPADTIVSEKIVMRTLAGGRTACLKATLLATEMHRISDYWDWLFSNWLPKAGVELADRPAYEVYRSTADKTGFNITLCLPLENPYPEHDYE